MPNKEVKDLADKIAQLLTAENKKTDLSALFASIEKINHRLDKVEEAQADRRPAFPDTKANHPSQDRFAVAEAIADAVFDLKSKEKEKACTFEPNGKPCDHCSMCSSRGF